MDVEWTDVNFSNFETNFIDEEFKRRLQKTLYYGKSPLTERTSLPVTELAVELLQRAAPRELGKIDTQLAASISRKACLSPCCLMLGLIYIDRLRQKSPEYLQQISSADLFIVAMMVASKFLYDDGEEEGVYNDEWAESAGTTTEDVNALEREFLRAIDWNLLARSIEFESKLRQLEELVALTKARERLWKLSYTDLSVLLRNLKYIKRITESLQECLKVFGVILSAYLMGLAILWAVFTAVTIARIRLSQEIATIHQRNADVSDKDLTLIDRVGFLRVSPEKLVNSKTESSLQRSKKIPNCDNALKPSGLSTKPQKSKTFYHATTILKASKTSILTLNTITDFDKVWANNDQSNSSTVKFERLSKMASFDCAVMVF